MVEVNEVCRCLWMFVDVCGCLKMFEGINRVYSNSKKESRNGENGDKLRASNFCNSLIPS